MERQQLRYRFERLDFFDLVRESIPSWNADATSEGFQIEFAGANEAAPVRGDAESLRRVFRNLLENAMRYSPGCRTVWVETARENGNAMLRVRDRGIGIDRAEQRRIFEKFVRGEAATGDWPFAVAASVSC
jgi:signal transduction histidine kinase